MRSNPYLTENFTNVIFATNDGDALEISASDRRYNVCPEQTQALIVPLDIKEIIADEIEQFAEFLWSYPTDEKSARTALNNQAKQLMHESRLDDFGSFARSLIRGRFSSFYDIYVAAIGADQEHGIYKNTLNNWAKRQKESKDGTTYLRNDELRFVFQYITGREVSIISFGKYMKKYRVEFERFRDGDRVRCFKVRWQEGLDDLLSITV
jgi:hypothetical protein